MRAALAHVICCLTLLPALTGCAPEAASKVDTRNQSQDAAPVVTARVEAREYALPIEGLGTARALESVVVTSRVNGRVSAVYMKEGAKVQRGEPLVLLEDDTERAELRAASAGVEQATARYQRVQELSATGLVSRDDLDEQRRIVDTAQARFDLAGIMLAQRTIRAPFSGTLGFRQVSPGTLVQPGAPIVTLDATDRMRVLFSVSETLLADLVVGGTVQVRAAAYRDKALSGQIETLGTRVDEVTRAIPVQALIDNAEGLIRPGMMLTLKISSKARNVKVIPEGALAPENAQQFVWRVAQDDTVEKIAIEVGVRAKGWVEVLSGIEIGDRVVLEGVGNLRPGRNVREVPQPGLQAARTGS